MTAVDETNMSKPPFSHLIRQSGVPVLVDFFARWCGPCQTMGPIIADISKKLSGKLQVIKINVDKHGALAAQFDVRSIPTVILFKNGKIAWRKTGLLTKRELITHINNSIN